jgi:outer membrane protein TolC
VGEVFVAVCSIRTRFFLVILVPLIAQAFLSGANITPAVASGEVVSLSEAVSESLANRPDLKAEIYRVKSAKERVGESKSNYYPQLSLSFETIYGNSFFGFFLFPGYNYADLNLLTVTLSQTIYDFGRTGSQVSRSRWALELEKGREAEIYQNTIRAAETDYFNLLSSQHQVLADKENLADAQEQLARAEYRFKAGDGVILDVTRAQVNVESDKLQLIRDKDAARSIAIDLAQVMGRSKSERIVAEDVSVDPNKESLPDFQADLARAMKHRPVMIEAVDQVRMSRSALENARSQNYPSVTGLFQSFTATMPQGSLPIPYAPNNTPYSTINLGGVINIPIFEGGLIMHQMSQAHYDLSSSIESRRSVRLRVITDLKKAILEIRDARQRLVEAKTERMNAEKNEVLVEEAYRVGSVHSVDVMDAQAALRQARESVIQARYQLMVGYADFQYARGTLSVESLSPSGR